MKCSSRSRIGDRVQAVHESAGGYPGQGRGLQQRWELSSSQEY